MSGAFLFTLALIAVLVGATYLLQIALWLFAFALFAVVWAVRVAAVVLGAAAWSIWWVFDRDAAISALRAESKAPAVTGPTAVRPLSFG